MLLHLSLLENEILSSVSSVIKGSHSNNFKHFIYRLSGLISNIKICARCSVLPKVLKQPNELERLVSGLCLRGNFELQKSASSALAEAVGSAVSTVKRVL